MADAGEGEEGTAVHQHISSLILVILSLKCRIKPVTYEEEDGGEDAGEEEEGDAIHQHISSLILVTLSL